MYIRLTANAREMLERSREFKRAIDNSVYHKGYPLNYREQRGTPSIQVSIALDGRQADVDVDYRSSTFPVMLFNGHLSASNSDVRAGDNAERHAARWSGFQNWWRGFFGVGLDRAPDTPDTTAALALPKIPRAGKKNIQVMARDFLQAWLVEGNAVAAMGYVSERAYACLAQDAPDPSAFDRGLAPFQILVNLKAAHDALGPHASLDRPDDGRAVDDPWTQGGASPRSGAVRHLRSARRRRGQVRLREPADTGLGGDPAGRRRRAFRHRLPHRRVEEGRLDRVAVGEGERVLEDRVVAGGAGARSRHRPRRRRPAQGRAHQGRSHARARGKGLRGSLDDPQGLRRRVPIPVDEKLRAATT